MPIRDSVDDKSVEKWKAIKEPPVEAAYDTWQNSDWKTKAPVQINQDRNHESQPAGENTAEDSNRDYFLAITVVSAEHLVLASRTEAPNAMFRASFTLYSPEHSRELAKQYTSDVIPRQSNPCWNFQMNFQFTRLTEFFEANQDKEICLELIHLRPMAFTAQSTAEEQLITSLSARLFDDFAQADLDLLERHEVLGLKSELLAESADGVKVHLTVEILTSGESLENPFREEMINNMEQDHDRSKKK